jgi:CarD family transcriptional regulator
MAARKKATKKASLAPARGNPKRSRSNRPSSKLAEPIKSTKTGKSAKRPNPPKPGLPKQTAKHVESLGLHAEAAAFVEKIASAPRKNAGAGEGLESKSGDLDNINIRGNAKEAESARDGGKPAAADLTGMATKASALSHGSGAHGAAKAAKPSQPARARSVEHDPAGGEQKTMKNSSNKHGFKLNEFVVYPAHGVGQIVTMEEQEVAGFKLELFVINFVKDKMTLRVPTSKVAGVGMRKLSDPEAARRSLEILTGRARVKRTMWSRRAQEYEAKINSGDINAIAEVVRDLYRSEAQPEQSYSERQLYEAALDRMMREIAAVQKLSETETLKVIETQLKKNQKRGAKADGTEGDEGIEEAA